MNYFKHVKCPALRAWNQLAYVRNLKKSHGDGVAERYLNALTKTEKDNVLMIASRVHVKGYDETLKEVMNFGK